MNKMSSLERVVYNILVQADLSFEQEKIFKDCYNGYYRYDFYLSKQQVIFEVNGQQHYEYTKKFYKHRTDFLKAQERDRRKITYALAHNIKIYCIPYWEINNLHNLDDLFNEKFLAHSKFHNDEAYRHQKSKLIK